jgi:hypothetical protein
MSEAMPMRVDRRIAIKWVLAAAAAAPSLRSAAWDAEAAKGYGTDPDLQRIYLPGQLWPLTLTPQLRRTAAALCDVILPADTHSPGAAAVGVVDFIDEWISAPYPRQQLDRTPILAGLHWIDAEADRRYSKAFAAISTAQQSAVCDDICYLPDAGSALVEAARFFARYRDLTAAGFYSTPAGHKDLQYVGNVALASFDGPPPEVLEALELND